MVVDWEQETGLLMSSGDVRIVRIWDTDREMKVQVSTPSLTGPPWGLPGASLGASLAGQWAQTLPSSPAPIALEVKG